MLLRNALKNHYRYPSPVGDLTTEDLFDLPLTSRTNRACLDDTAKQINRELKDSEQESFVEPAVSGTSELAEKLEIVKSVIALRIEEREAAKDAVAKKEKRERIMAIIANKEDQNLQEKGLGELKSLLDDLG